MIYKPALTSGPQEEDAKSFSNLENIMLWASLPMLPQLSWVSLHGIF